ANLIAVRWNGSTPAETLVQMDVREIELVMISGRPHLLSPQMGQRWPQVARRGLEWITVDGTPRLVRAPVRLLLSEAAKCLSDGVRLAGREVSAESGDSPFPGRGLKPATTSVAETCYRARSRGL